MGGQSDRGRCAARKRTLFQFVIVPVITKKEEIVPEEERRGALRSLCATRKEDLLSLLLKYRQIPRPRCPHPLAGRLTHLIQLNHGDGRE